MNKILSIVTLLVLMVVPGNGLAQNPPDWSVNPSDFQYNASMIGILIFNEQESTDSEDIIAAFVGEECRGVKTDGIYFSPSEHWVFGLTIYGNILGEVITIKAYDVSADHVLDSTDFSYSFVPRKYVFRKLTNSVWNQTCQVCTSLHISCTNPFISSESGVCISSK